MSSRVNPIRLFVTHNWEENDDYTRVFEYLEAPGTFYYLNTSQPHGKRPIDKESQREDLRRQIAPCEVVIALPGVYRAEPDLVQFQMTFAKAADRPIVAMENFGSNEPLAKAIKELADEVSAVERAQFDRCACAARRGIKKRRAGTRSNSSSIDGRRPGMRRSARQLVADKRRYFEVARGSATSTLRSCTTEALWTGCESTSARHIRPKISTMSAAQSSAS